MPDSRPWIVPLRALLEQGAELAAGLSREAFACPSPLAPRGGIGAHLRHVGDSVRAFLGGLEGGAIDYDRRARDERSEREPERAGRDLLALSRELLRHEHRDPSQALRVRAEADLVGTGWQQSTLGRELGSLVSHTVHHYALIAVLLRARGLEPPEELGVAPSTLAHWQEERTPCAPPVG